MQCDMVKKFNPLAHFRFNFSYNEFQNSRSLGQISFSLGCYLLSFSMYILLQQKHGFWVALLGFGLDISVGLINSWDRIYGILEINCHWISI